MSDVMTTAVAGAVAGFGVALPMGAVGVLLVQEGLRDRRGAMAAAAAVASVDLLYAGVATVVGPWVATALTGVEAWVRLVSAVVLGVIAGLGLRGSRRPRAVGTSPGDRTAVPGAAKHTDPAPEGIPVQRDRGAHRRIFLRFAALTLINPTTALYFVALTTAQGAELNGGTAGLVFVGAVFLASLLWQQTLVLISAALGSRLPDSARIWTFRIGFALVAAYAVKVALPLPTL
ncbi:LysE family transporter [Streptomyces sp. NPDC056500]|uniref:LysE family transporter n=1 Tax=Streptomyces sp. NPDC056500 TaxID=3345840 RepID=UPI003684DEF3